MNLSPILEVVFSRVWDYIARTADVLGILACMVPFVAWLMRKRANASIAEAPSEWKYTPKPFGFFAVPGNHDIDVDQMPVIITGDIGPGAARLFEKARVRRFKKI